MSKAIFNVIHVIRLDNLLLVSTTAILLKNPPADCQNIIDDYSNGKLLMYEYKIQMARCMKKTKDDAGNWISLVARWLTVHWLIEDAQALTS